ncbi:MAG: NAD(P)H-dependent oxidoreductase [Woeseia sp.]
MTTTSNETQVLRVLEINASGRHAESVSRRLSGELIDTLEQRYGRVQKTSLDVTDGLPLVNEAWIGANFTAAEERSAAHKDALAESDRLVQQLMDTDVVVIGAPIYNFGVPAGLKAWVDMIARARVTFEYTENGPVGLLKNKKAFVVIASGGVAVNSPVDFATPYLRQVLSFIGIDDVEVIAADQLNIDADSALERARLQIARTATVLPSMANLAA